MTFSRPFRDLRNDFEDGHKGGPGWCRHVQTKLTVFHSHGRFSRRSEICHQRVTRPAYRLPGTSKRLYIDVLLFSCCCVYSYKGADI